MLLQGFAVRVLTVALASMPVPDADIPPHRYAAALAAEIEARWQARWDDSGVHETPNPGGRLASGTAPGGPKLFVMDMFPYPSGSGLHVGHPLGYIATDVYVRFKRMCGFNVLYTMGFDAFGLPAEEHARQTGQHPRINTEANIDNMRRQLDRLGLGHDKRRGVATTDVGYYRWTQWIFLQIFNSWFDPEARRARPVSELIDEFSSGRRPSPGGRPWSELSEAERRADPTRHKDHESDEDSQRHDERNPREPLHAAVGLGLGSCSGRRYFRVRAHRRILGANRKAREFTGCRRPLCVDAHYASTGRTDAQLREQ